MSVIDASTISKGEHEQRRMPDIAQTAQSRLATRRSAIVTSQAATIINESGAT